MPSKVEIITSDNGGWFFGGEFEEVCNQHYIKQEFINIDSPKQNGVVERALGTIQNAGLVPWSQAPTIFPHVQLLPTKSLWVEVVYWACDSLDHIVTTVHPREKSPHKMEYGAGAPASPHPSVRPAYCCWNPPIEVALQGRAKFLPGAGIRPSK